MRSQAGKAERWLGKVPIVDLPNKERRQRQQQQLVAEVEVNPHTGKKVSGEEGAGRRKVSRKFESNSIALDYA